MSTPREISLFMVGARGFEPPTPCTPCTCATRLRYAPTNNEADCLVFTY